MTPAESSPSYFQSVLAWLHEGYPDGIPPTDYYPLLALLARTLDEDEVVSATWAVLKNSDPENPVTQDEIRRAVHTVIATEPNRTEINQVAARLALVGWPLADQRGPAAVR